MLKQKLLKLHQFARQAAQLRHFSRKKKTLLSSSPHPPSLTEFWLQSGAQPGGAEVALASPSLLSSRQENLTQISKGLIKHVLDFICE